MAVQTMVSQRQRGGDAAQGPDGEMVHRQSKQQLPQGQGGRIDRNGGHAPRATAMRSATGRRRAKPVPAGRDGRSRPAGQNRQVPRPGPGRSRLRPDPSQDDAEQEHAAEHRQHAVGCTGGCGEQDDRIGWAHAAQAPSRRSSQRNRRSPDCRRASDGRRRQLDEPHRLPGRQVFVGRAGSRARAAGRRRRASATSRDTCGIGVAEIAEMPRPGRAGQDAGRLALGLGQVRCRSDRRRACISSSHAGPGPARARRRGRPRRTGHSRCRGRRRPGRCRPPARL